MGAPIEKGEVIASIPSFLHLSVKTAAVAFPELYKQVEELKGFMPQFEKDIRVAACVTKLLAEAVKRYTSRVEVMPAGDTVWALYVDQLLGEDYQTHPYWRWVSNGPQTMADLLPSPEGPHAEQLAADILRTFRLIKHGVPDELLGQGFDAGLFLHARLSMLTRVFHTTPEYSSLVPVIDLFNHSSDATCDWVFDAKSDAMVLTSNRAHAVGEQ